MRQVKIGAPGYILLKEIQKDMPGTLKRVAALGFDGFEITGFFGHSPEEWKQACQEAGLEPYGCFAQLTRLAGENKATRGGNWDDFASAFDIPGETTEDALSYIQDIGCSYVGLLVPNAPMDQTVLNKIKDVAAVAKAKGVKLQYHNHNYEYNNVVDGVYRMDYILENTDSSLLFEPDLGWMEIAGYSSEKALRRWASRIEIVHLKDYWRENNDPALPHRFRPTGYGVMDWARLLPLCEELIAPKWYTADHDSAYEGDIYEELGMSVDYIRGMLKYC